MQTTPHKNQSSNTDFLPDLASTEIKQLQQDIADNFGLPLFFTDTLKNGSKAPELAIIPAGQYEMGSNKNEFGHSKEEYPQHYSHIHKPYAIGRFTITAEEFDVFINDTEWQIRPELIHSTGKEPVINIRAHDANLYLNWLSKQTGERYRLPTESEWEFAARAGTTTAFHYGDEVTCKEVHFHSLFPYNEAKQKKHWYLPLCAPASKALEVGTKEPNDWGLYDVHGNVWEFTDSPWRDTHLNNNRDGSSDLISPWIVTKGGSWFDDAIHSRSASRKKRLYEEMDTNLGFRIVREL
jgi:formylglycine-generating enzyme required for sulfatase activity